MVFNGLLKGQFLKLYEHLKSSVLFDKRLSGTKESTLKA